ncbi:MAG: hypothetical protein QM660_10010 [Dysgonomonas sp.]
MKIYPLLVTVSLLSIFLLSCEGDSAPNDNEPPQIVSVKINNNDTISLGNNDTIIINKEGSLMDTLVAGRYVKLSAIFTDNEALASYMLRLDTTIAVPENSTDTACLAIKSWSSILGYKSDTIIRQQGFLLLSDTTYTVEGNIKKLYEGTDYKIIVGCVDKAGNSTEIVKKVYVMRMQTLIDQRKKK